jgi:hypothetical protein
MTRRSRTTPDPRTAPSQPRRRARLAAAVVAALATAAAGGTLATAAPSVPSVGAPAAPTVSVPVLPPPVATGLSSSGGLPTGAQPGANDPNLAQALSQLPPGPTTEPPIAGAGSSRPPAPRGYVHDPGAPASDLQGCNPLDPSVCLYPFPSDYVTRADANTPTGRRLDLRLAAMPRNLAGKPIDNSEIDRLDGFSPGDPITVKVPGLDTPAAFANTGAVPITDVAQTYRADQPVVVINTKTLQRQLIWAEIDSNASTPDQTSLIIRPARNLDENTTYIVALRGLRDANGTVLQPNPTFRALRDGTPSTDPFVLRERAHYASVFRTLGAAGIGRSDLYLAWDFTVGSWQSIAGRMLHIRDDAFRQLGDTNLADGRVQGSAPKFKVTKVTDNPDPQILRQVDGWVRVPCYLDTPRCGPLHSQFLLGPDGMPRQLPGNYIRAKFECRIPASAVSGGVVQPSHISLYGHGLFGGRGEVGAGNVTNMANGHDFTFCATDWIGMASNDVPNAATALVDLSNFNTLVDRLQQGYLNFLYVGRAMLHANGFAANPAFQLGGKRLLDTSALYYDGNSQGGIYGGTLTAIAPDFRRAVIGVSGMNYSTLLSRSTDFGDGSPPSVSPTVPPDTGNANLSYAYPLYTSYPQQISRPLVFSLMQLLWDRADPNGYAEHMTTHPYPNTPSHEVLMEIAFGDHQVSNWAAEVEARTIGAHALRSPMLAPGRSIEVTPYYGIPAFSSLPAKGSGFVVWDSGTSPDPAANVAPKDGPGRAGHDPHEDPRADPKNQAQKAAFLTTGEVVDTCGGGPCYADGYTGP